MLSSPKRSHLIVLATFLFVFFYYQSSSPRQVSYGIVLDQGGEQLKLELTDTEMKDLIENEIREVQTEESLTTSGNLSAPTKKKEDVEFVVINNKVYRKGDPIPAGKSGPLQLQPSGGKRLKQMDFSKYKGEEREFMEEHRQEMLKRASRVSSMCKARPNLRSSVPLHLVWDLQHKPNVVWCPNYKVASTSWMINYLRLAHFNEDNPELLALPPNKREQNRFKVKYGARQSKVFDLYPPPSDTGERNRIFKDAVRIIFVRHPFMRILSAYLDKMSKMDPKPAIYRFRELQLQIISKYRSPESKETSPFPTFSEFVQYVIDFTKGFQTAADWQSNVKCWTPYWSQCNVCGSDYTLILKLETMTEDERFLITLADYKELKERKQSEWRHKHNGSSYSHVGEYFSQLTHHQVQQLHQRYLMDFQLFGYKIDNVFLENLKE